MSTATRPQFKPTPELQGVLNVMGPQLCQTLNINNQTFTLLSFSRYENDANRFTLYAEAGEKRYRIELAQELGADQKFHMKVLEMFEIVTK